MKVVMCCREGIALWPEEVCHPDKIHLRYRVSPRKNQQDPNYAIRMGESEVNRLLLNIRVRLLQCKEPESSALTGLGH